MKKLKDILLISIPFLGVGILFTGFLFSIIKGGAEISATEQRLFLWAVVFLLLASIITNMLARNAAVSNTRMLMSLKKSLNTFSDSARKLTASLNGISRSIKMNGNQVEKLSIRLSDITSSLVKIVTAKIKKDVNR